MKITNAAEMKTLGDMVAIKWPGKTVTATIPNAYTVFTVNGVGTSILTTELPALDPAQVFYKIYKKVDNL